MPHEFRCRNQVVFDAFRKEAGQAKITFSHARDNKGGILVFASDDSGDAARTIIDGLNKEASKPPVYEINEPAPEADNADQGTAPATETTDGGSKPKRGRSKPAE